MSYQHYVTEGFVLGHLDIKESSRLLHVLTEDFGLVMALAQGVREPKSKMRTNLQDYSCLNLGLVRGRDFWRITSAEENSWMSSINSVPRTCPAVIRIFSLVRRLVQGEAKDQELYQIIKEVLQNKDSELIAVAKILKQLGYLKAESLKLESNELLQAVNHSLNSSQL